MEEKNKSLNNFDELSELGLDKKELEKLIDDTDDVELAVDLKGFESAFPKWDLHPPKN